MYASRLHDMDRLPLDSAQLQKPCPYPGLLAPWYAQAACTSRQMTSKEAGKPVLSYVCQDDCSGSMQHLGCC